MPEGRTFFASRATGSEIELAARQLMRLAFVADHGQEFDEEVGGVAPRRSIVPDMLVAARVPRRASPRRASRVFRVECCSWGSIRPARWVR